MAYYGFAEYVPVAEKKANALNAIKKLKEKDPNISPVIIEGTLGKTWWSKSWNKNLESYADYSNRISRGKSYVRQHCVVDLKISKGEIFSKVQGSRIKPYDIEIKIETLTKEAMNHVLMSCQKSIESIEQLVEGKFPKGLETLICDKNEGLFPSPKAIQFSCTCPDYAVMCKHVAATLYGIGVRLEEDPLLFFELRDIDINGLIKKSIEEKLENMLKHAGDKSDRTIEDDNIEDLFGF